MLQEEISWLKGENTETNPQTTIVLQENAFFPNWYMKQENERFSYYQRLLQAQKLNDIEDLRAEIEDRYGRLPREVETL